MAANHLTNSEKTEQGWYEKKVHGSISITKTQKRRCVCLSSFRYFDAVLRRTEKDRVEYTAKSSTGKDTNNKI